MNYRSKTLWLPGLVTLTLASASLMALQLFASLRHSGYSGDGRAMVVDIPWLIMLPLFGAAGAYLSRRAGGSRVSGLLAATFPAIVMLGVLCLALSIGIFVERNAYVIHHLQYFGRALLLWTVIPGAALLVGALCASATIRSQHENHARSSTRAV